MKSIKSLFVGFVCASVVAAQGTFSPARPPAIPLAVRSPYLSTWLDVGSDDGDGGTLAGRWAQFWPGKYESDANTNEAKVGIIHRLVDLYSHTEPRLGRLDPR